MRHTVQLKLSPSAPPPHGFPRPQHKDRFPAYSAKKRKNLSGKYARFRFPRLGRQSFNFMHTHIHAKKDFVTKVHFLAKSAAGDRGTYIFMKKKKGGGMGRGGTEVSLTFSTFFLAQEATLMVMGRRRRRRRRKRKRNFWFFHSRNSPIYSFACTKGTWNWSPLIFHKTLGEKKELGIDFPKKKGICLTFFR